MRKILKIIGLLLLAIFIGGGIYLWTLSKPMPVGEPGEQADLLAQKILAAMDKTAWDTTKIVQWTFRGEHHFVWDKSNHLVEVKWEKNRVLLNANKISGKAFYDNKKLEGEQANEMVQTAYSYFCNDGFWLNAPIKVFDYGTKRSLVTNEDGSQSLLVNYASGGVTPGDAYLWHLDEYGQPTSYQMWVSIIPIKGLTVSWQDWKTLASGAKYAENHMLGSLNISITNTKSGETLGDLGLDENLFEGI